MTKHLLTVHLDLRADTLAKVGYDGISEYEMLIYLQLDRSKCAVCQTPVNHCLKKARAFGRDWITFIVLHGCINPECSASG